MAFSGVSGSMEEDFFTKSQSWKNFRQNRNQDAVHAQKSVTVPLTGVLTGKDGAIYRKKTSVNAFHGNERTYAQQSRDNSGSRTQTICFLISISAVVLKLMVKITSIFTFRSQCQPAGICIPPWSWGVEEQMLIFPSRLSPGRVKGSWHPIPKLTIVLIWKTSAWLKCGMTSNGAVENLPQRKL